MAVVVFVEVLDDTGVMVLIIDKAVVPDGVRFVGICSKEAEGEDIESDALEQADEGGIVGKAEDWVCVGLLSTSDGS